MGCRSSRSPPFVVAPVGGGGATSVEDRRRTGAPVAGRVVVTSIQAATWTLTVDRPMTECAGRHGAVPRHLQGGFRSIGARSTTARERRANGRARRRSHTSAPGDVVRAASASSARPGRGTARAGDDERAVHDRRPSHRHHHPRRPGRHRRRVLDLRRSPCSCSWRRRRCRGRQRRVCRACAACSAPDVLIVGIAYLAFAWGAWGLQPWAWTLGVGLAAVWIVLGVFDLFGGNFGAIVSIAISGAIAYYLFRPEIKAAFGRT